MKLERLTATNFQKVADIDLVLSDQRVHLFCGRNEAGKSAIADMVRFAIRGTSSRVELKKDYKKLIHRGGKKGVVTLQADGTVYTRDVGTGKCEENTDLPEDAQIAADLAFGSQTFVDLDLKERLNFLYRLTGVKADPEGIVARMKKRGIDEQLIERLRPTFRISCDGAYALTQAELKRLRSKWSSIAGEVWGIKKAEGWSPEPPQKLADDEVDVEYLQSQIGICETTISEFQQQLGKAESELQERARLTASAERLDSYVRNLPTLQADLASLRRDLDGGVYGGKTYVGLKEEVQTDEELIERAEAAQHVLTCPACTAALRMGADGDLEFVDSESVNYAKTEDEVLELRDKAREGRGRIQKLEADIDAVTKKIGAAEQSTKLHQEIASRLNVLAKPAEVDLVRTNLQQTQSELQVLRSQLDGADKYQQAVKDGQARKESAALVYEEILRWTAADEAMAPTGIPQELLKEALKKINEHMLKASRAVGWQAPEITDDMEIMRGDDTYGLLSESAQWRVSVIVADAISTMSGLNMLILDRMDVLDPPSRAPFLRWITGLTGYDSILIMATMKEPPVGLPPDIAVHWLENGEVKQPLKAGAA